MVDIELEEEIELIKLLLEFPINMTGITECQSLQSQDTIGQLDCLLPSGAMGAIKATYSILADRRSRYWNTDRWFLRMSNLCYFHQYNGKWATLQALLETSTNLEEYSENCRKLLGDRTFYGNIQNWIPSSQQERFVTLKDPERSRKKRARKSRIRGYRDKGTYVPGHKKGRLPGACIVDQLQPLDYRNRIRHPLLRENTTPGRDPPPEHVSIVLQRIENEVRLRKEYENYDSKTERDDERSHDQGTPETQENQIGKQKETSTESSQQKRQTQFGNQGSSQIPKKGTEEYEETPSGIFTTNRREYHPRTPKRAQLGS